MSKAVKDCEIDFRPMTAYRGQPWPKRAPNRWNDTLEFALRMLRSELVAAGSPDAIVETWHGREDYTLSGRPRSGITPRRPEVQVWFRAGQMPVCVPSGKYANWINNLKAVAMTLNRQRLVRDYGCFTIEEQYTAFSALPPSTGNIGVGQTGSAADCAAFLIRTAGMEADLTVEDVLANRDVLRSVARVAAKRAHPDVGGTDSLLDQVSKARAEIERVNGWSR